VDVDHVDDQDDQEQQDPPEKLVPQELEDLKDGED
jgi:hypothetical protein